MNYSVSIPANKPTGSSMNKLSRQSLLVKDINSLECAVKALQQLPHDFRDLAVDGPGWRLWYKEREHAREAMDAWKHGPIYILSERQQQQQYLEKWEIDGLRATNRKLTWQKMTAKGLKQLTQDIFGFMCVAEDEGYSILYLRLDKPHLQLAAALNEFCKAGRWNIRVRNQIHESKPTYR